MQQIIDDSTAVEDADQLVPGCLQNRQDGKCNENACSMEIGRLIDLVTVDFVQFLDGKL